MNAPQGAPDIASNDDGSSQQLNTVVWATGNVGRAAIRSVMAHPQLALSAVVVSNPNKVGSDAGNLSDYGEPIGISATDDIEGVLSSGPDAVVYAGSGDIRPDEALEDICAALRAGAVVVTPAIYSLYDPAGAPANVLTLVRDAVAEGNGKLFVSGIDPGWGNDILPVLLTAVAGTIDSIRCREIFDYSAYDQPDAVRTLVGMGQPMAEVPPMVMPGVPTMVWGGQIRLIARALEAELDDIRETVERRPLETTIHNEMGAFEAGTQGGLRFEVQGIIDGEAKIIVEHVTRIDPSCAPDWPYPADGGVGAHTVTIEGRPRIELNVEATDEGGNRAAGGNATAANRLVNSIPWLIAAKPGIYDALSVPLSPGVGKLRGGPK